MRLVQGKRQILILEGSQSQVGGSVRTRGRHQVGQGFGLPGGRGPGAGACGVAVGRCIERSWGGFPGGAVVKNPPANAGDTGSSPGLGRSHMPRSN